ncbi:MAG: hypothetical protein K2F60_05335 [Oscillospiraceae bacterium]|nr:hypothetical protein [Oscillospiraceae bacterium]MDE6103930.1 hypothetical protein [Oscillospiraceae bacterium]
MKNNLYIKKLVDSIEEHCTELKKVYLISNKIDTNGVLTSFKLAIIVDNSVENNSELECRLYLNIDCELPFDLVIYREDEFEKLKCEIGTFAWKISNSGMVLYG